MTRHVLDLDDLSPDELRDVLAVARETPAAVLGDASVAIVMGLPSLRTRNATELAVVDLGGHAVVMTGAEVGIDERELAEDVARTLGAFHRVLCVRVLDHRILERMARALDAHEVDAPVVNLLSDAAHPVQAIADLLTIEDALAERGISEVRGQTVAWVGDANNVARSLALGAVGVGARVAVSSPRPHRLDDDDLSRIRRYAEAAGRGGTIELVEDPASAVAGAAAICTDVWVSMGEESERDAKRAAFEGYQVDEALLAKAPGAVFLHCLPAHRGEEVTDAVLDGPASRVWAQVAHRRTAMRGLLAWLVRSHS